MSTVARRLLLPTLRDRVSPEHSALIIVDMQNDYVSEGGAAFRRNGTVEYAAPIIPRNRALLEAARDAGVLVVFVKMTLDYPVMRYASDVDYLRRIMRYGEEPMLVRGSWGHEVVEALTPLPTELIVEKHRSSSFQGTDLDLILRSNRIESIVVTGVVTQGCVFATAHQGLLNDYYVTVVRDCVATSNQKLHDAALFLLESSLCLEESVVPAQRIIDEWAASAASSSTPVAALASSS